VWSRVACGDEVTERRGAGTGSRQGLAPPTEGDLATSRGAALGEGLPRRDEPTLRLRSQQRRREGSHAFLYWWVVPCLAESLPLQGAEGPKASLVLPAMAPGREAQAAADPG